jgi:hypothetical protein
MSNRTEGTDRGRTDRDRTEISDPRIVVLQNITNRKSIYENDHVVEELFIYGLSKGSVFIIADCPNLKRVSFIEPQETKDHNVIINLERLPKLQELLFPVDRHYVRGLLLRRIERLESLGSLVVSDQISIQSTSLFSLMNVQCNTLMIQNSKIMHIMDIKTKNFICNELLCGQFQNIKTETLYYTLGGSLIIPKNLFESVTGIKKINGSPVNDFIDAYNVRYNMININDLNGDIIRYISAYIKPTVFNQFVP